MGLRIDSPALTEQLLGVLRDRGPDRRYRVTLDDGGRLVWTTRDHGVERVYHDEPEASPALKWSLHLLAPFAPEQML